MNKKQKTYLIPNDLIKQIKESKELIKKFITLKKSGVQPSTAKHFSFNEKKALHLIGYLYHRTNNIYRLKKQHKGIPQNLLTDIIGFSNRNQTRFYLELLISLNIIKRSGKAKIGISSFEYDIMNCDLFTFRYNDKTQFTSMTFEVKVNNKITKFINEKLNNSIIERSFIDTQTKEYKVIKNKLIDDNVDRKIAINYNEFMLENKAYNFNVQNSNNRRSNIYCYINKEFRDLIKIDDEETIGIDISNSQPAILANYIESKTNILTEDQKLFIELAYNGHIYEYLSDKMNIELSDAKTLWMKAGYGDTSIVTIGDEILRYNKNAVKFAEYFPNVIDILDTFKYDKYNQCAIKLQIMESKLINKISDILFEQGIVNITIYDEIIVKKSDFDKTTEVFYNFIEENDINLTLKCDKEPYKTILYNKSNTEEQKAINTESNIISDTIVQELKEDVQTKPEIDYKLKTQLKETIVIKLTDMFNYTMVSNLQFRPILNKIIDESYRIIKDGKKLNKTILKEMIIKYK